MRYTEYNVLQTMRRSRSKQERILGIDREGLHHKNAEPQVSTSLFSFQVHIQYRYSCCEVSLNIFHDFDKFCFLACVTCRSVLEFASIKQSDQVAGLYCFFSRTCSLRLRPRRRPTSCVRGLMWSTFGRCRASRTGFRSSSRTMPTTISCPSSTK